MTDESSSTTPVAKKPKLLDKAQQHQLVAVANTAWEHYRTYIDSTTNDDDSNDDGCGDMDELEELLQVVVKPYLSQLHPYTCSAPETTTVSQVTELLPVLISVAYHHLADHAISDSLELQQQQQRIDALCDEDGDMVLSKALKKCQHLIEQSLHWFPQNAAMWSMAANFARMFHLLPPNIINQWYDKAVDGAVTVRAAALKLLEEGETPRQVKEWIELLWLGQTIGVDYIVEGGEGTSDNEQGQTSDKEEQGHFSSSAVEATARFMAAMLHSTAGRHDCALHHLRHFDLTHRLHANVWQPSSQCATKKGVEPTNNEPVIFSSRNALPDHQYQRLCQVFAPKAAYWSESEYNRRGYYSYYMDIPESVSKITTRNPSDDETPWAPQNLIEDAICNHLLPLVQQLLKAAYPDQTNNSAPHICGAEWWVHTRAIQSNLGHNLHFDTDEALLKQEGRITHPLYSSVLYLTGGDADGAAAGGATILLDQTPGSECVAQKAWRCVPRNNSFLVFPGDLLHGVLPCPGPVQESKDGRQLVPVGDEHDIAGAIRSQWIPVSKHAEVEQPTPHRLTFMVGFWTRRVPDKMTEQKLYGPCGPLPPRPTTTPDGSKDEDEGSTEGLPQHHTWVDEICKGYPTNDSRSNHALPASLPSQMMSALPIVTPAWETIESLTATNNQETDLFLEIPRAIDHRFFVRGAPTCFWDSIFERCNDSGEDDDSAGE